MKKTSNGWKSFVIILAIIIIVFGAWYWWAYMQNIKTFQQANKQATTATITAVLNIGTDNASLGNYLTASNGMTLYYFTKDTPGVSNCYDACAKSWTPYIVSLSNPLLGGEGITGSISTITRTDGTIQLTYNGTPLYFWNKDVKPGDTNGQNIGGVWFVVKP
jgi:predicted lipoprotein with Yx(FWY)xxD motif